MNPTGSLPLVDVEVVLPDIDGAATVVRLRGELDLSSLRSVDHQLAPVVADADGDVIVDLAGLEFIDVAGLNLLARTAEALTADDRALRLRSPSAILRRMMQITGIDQCLEVDDPGT